MKFKNPVSVVSPVNGEHATNKDYVDGKMVTKTWAEYQALSEGEKCNGALYDIPDMPTAGQGGIITTYTHISQLGLSNGCSVGDVFNALPNNSLAEIACQMQDYADDTTVSYITDLPSPHVLLIIRKHIANSTIRFDITAKLSARDSVTNNFMWIGQLKGSDGTGVTWEKVCTTSVEDVELTNWDISVTDKFAVCNANKNTYSVKNAICVFNISLECKVANTGNTVNVKSNLPVPVANVTARIMGTTGSSSIQVNISKSDGSMSINGGAKGIIYEGQLVYILKNS